MTALSAKLFSDLIGAPFVDGGRGPAGYDCVGLAAEIQRRCGQHLPAYLSDEAELHRQLAAGGALEVCRRIPHPVAGCVVLVKMLDRERHIGTMIDPYRMLHTTRQTGGAVLETINTPLWFRRILGFYSVEDLRGGNTHDPPEAGGRK